MAMMLLFSPLVNYPMLNLWYSATEQIDRRIANPDQGGVAIALSQQFRAGFERTITPGIPAFVSAESLI
jgi:hypothetical protein